MESYHSKHYRVNVFELIIVSLLLLILFWLSKRENSRNKFSGHFYPFCGEPRLGYEELRHTLLDSDEVQCRKNLSIGYSCIRHPLSGNLQLMHITKTGGTSLETIAMKQGFRWGFNNKENLLGRQKNNICDNAEWHWPTFFFEEQVYGDSDTFMVVRHPIDRVISEYKWEVAYHQQLLDEVKGKPFKESILLRTKKFYRDVGNISHAGDREVFNRYLQKRLQSPFEKCSHYRRQSSYLYEPGNTKQLQVRHVLRYEHLSRDVENLDALYKTKLAQELTHTKEMVSHHMTDISLTINDMSAETLRLVHDFYLADFLVFGYPTPSVFEK